VPGLHKHRIKSDIKKLLAEKEIEGNIRSKILNSLVNYTYKTALEYGRTQEAVFLSPNKNPFDSSRDDYVIT
jgi:hypothetical protein